ncbi:MAG: ABC transporter substrate-binding protein [Chloroflexi bacterium]|nr:ABC transporter substrate-binding protein [Chloroflexota bacterium]
MSHHIRAGVSRRRVLKGAAAGMFGAAGAAVLAACGETQVVTKEVIKEVPVETVVTKEVVKEVPVETVVTKEVVKEVPVEKLVTTEVVKEVEVIKEVAVEVEKIVTKEVEVIKEVTAEMMIPEGPISGGTLNHSGSGPNHQDIFNPLKQVSSSQAYITDYVFLPLWYGDTWGPGDTPAMTGEWDKGVANSWDEVERARVYNFHINPDVTWHDQVPLTADDVLFGAKMGLDKNYGSGQHKKAWGRIEGAEAWGENPTDNVEDVPGLTKIDEMTVQIAIDRPDSAWWASRDWHLPPMARHHYAGLDPATAIETRALNPLGNGPMIWERYVTQQFADMTAHKDFAYGTPYVNDYVVRYGERNALDAAMEAGEQDFHRASNIEAFQRLASLGHLRPFPQRSPFGGHVFLNQSAEIFSDMTLEQQSLMIEAMVRAVDRDTINNELHAGTLFISDYIFEHVALMQDPPEGTFRAMPYDPDAARALVEEAQWDSEKEIQWIKWGPPTPTDLALKNYWEQVGIKVEFFLVDGSAVIEKLYQERVHDLVLANMGGDQAVVDACLRVCSDRVYELGGWNHSNINRPWIDEAYADMFAAENNEALRERWIEFATRLHSKGNMVAGLLWRGSLRNLYHRRLQGAFYMQFYAMPVHSPIERVWLDDYWEER